MGLIVYNFYYLFEYGVIYKLYSGYSCFILVMFDSIK